MSSFQKQGKSHSYMEQSTPRKGAEFTLWKRVVFIAVFFLITPIALGTSFISLAALAKTNEVDDSINSTLPLTQFPLSGSQVYASLPSSFPSISGDIIEADVKVGLIEQYLTENDSPLAPYAYFVVETAEKYGLDYRLITAIARKESGLCRAIPEGSHNCWGWGIHSKGTLMFDSFEEGVETVSKGIKENYIDQGYTTLEEIMGKYTPLSQGTWAEGVNFYMEQILDQ